MLKRTKKYTPKFDTTKIVDYNDDTEGYYSKI